MELAHVGGRCQHPGCKQLDFLPMDCKLCGHSFCENHGSVYAHQCPEAHTLECKRVECPLCNKGVNAKAGEDIVAKMDEHIASGCVRHVLELNKRKCAARGCKAKNLREYNSISCRHCRHRFCVAHRTPADHHCGDKTRLRGWKKAMRRLARTQHHCSLAARAASSAAAGSPAVVA